MNACRQIQLTSQVQAAAHPSSSSCCRQQLGHRLRGRWSQLRGRWRGHSPRVHGRSPQPGQRRLLHAQAVPQHTSLVVPGCQVARPRRTLVSVGLGLGQLPGSGSLLLGLFLLAGRQAALLLLLCALLWHRPQRERHIAQLERRSTSAAVCGLAEGRPADDRPHHLQQVRGRWLAPLGAPREASQSPPSFCVRSQLVLRCSQVASMHCRTRLQGSPDAHQSKSKSSCWACCKSSLSVSVHSSGCQPQARGTGRVHGDCILTGCLIIRLLRFKQRAASLTPSAAHKQVSKEPEQLTCRKLVLQAYLTVQLPAGPDTASMHLPAHYKSLVGTHTGPSFRAVQRVVTKELKKPGPGEVVVKIQHAGINGGCETFRARGEHWFQREDRSAEFPLGAEGTGVVAAVGPDVDSLEVWLGFAHLWSRERSAAQWLCVRHRWARQWRAPAAAPSASLSRPRQSCASRFRQPPGRPARSPFLGSQQLLHLRCVPELPCCRRPKHAG